MANFWLKMKLWTKVVVFSIIGAYALAFIWKNWDLEVNGQLNFLFFWFDKPRILFILLFTAIISIACWMLIGMVFATIRQFRDLRERNRTARLEKEMADMRVKAGMLQTRETPAPVDPKRAEPPKNL